MTYTSPYVEAGQTAFDFPEIVFAARQLAALMRRHCPISGKPQLFPEAECPMTAAEAALEVGQAAMWLESQLDPLESVRRIGPDHVFDALPGENPLRLATIRVWEVFHRRVYPAMYPRQDVDLPPVFPPVAPPVSPRPYFHPVDGTVVAALEAAADELERLLKPEVQGGLEEGTASAGTTKDAPEAEQSPLDEILDKLSPDQRRIVRYLWARKHAVNWATLAEECGLSPDDAAIRKALQRLAERLENEKVPGLYLDNSCGTKRVKLVRP